MMGAMSKYNRMVIGAYTSESDGSAVGLTGWQSPGKDATQQSVLELPSPSWVVAHPDGDLLYTAAGKEPGRIHAIGIDAEANLTPINSAEMTNGSATHLALTPDARFVVAAHYGHGSASSFSINPDRSIGEQVDQYTFRNWSGPIFPRQTQAHAHQIVMDGDGCWIPNLGGDVVHRLGIDADGHFLSQVAPVRLPAGTGPRHLVLVEDLMVVACELSAQLWVGRRRGETFDEVGLVGSTFRTSTEDAPIHPSGIGVHVSDGGIQVLVANRGCDTVAVFNLDPATGGLEFAQEFVTTAWPRDLKVYGDRLWVAGQTGHHVATHLRDPGTGQWQPGFVHDTPSPSCILLLR